VKERDTRESEPLVRHTVVLGVGNILLTDDGAGVHAVRHLSTLLCGRPDVEVVDGGTLSFTLAPTIAGTKRLIVIDAAQLDAPPGTVRVFFGDTFDKFLGCAKLSVHEVSLVDLLDIARLTDGIPDQRVLITVQPERIAWGEALTPAVHAGVEHIVARVIELLDGWPVPEQMPVTEHGASLA
jgi:hydrogenase maturation protease